MIISNLRDLKRLAQLCRANGIATIKVDGIEMTLGPMPKANTRSIVMDEIPEANIKVPQYNGATASVEETVDHVIETDGLTEEQMLFYSAEGHTPEDEAQV